MLAERPCTGALVEGRYLVGALLGRGGAADVWRARDIQTGEEVALKAFRDDAAIAVDPDRAARETAATAGVHHPAVVEVLGTCAAPTCLVLELVDGEDLGALLSDGPLPAETVREIGADIADALAVLHARRLVHRDVKPGNILVPERPGPVAAKLTDFGIVAALDGTRLTATDAILGTAAYLSPEQVSGGEVGTASDVYALGLVLLESLTGVRAFPGGLAESAVARLNRPPRLPADASPRLASLLAAMTALDPAARPHASEVAATLRALAGRMTGDSPATAAVPRIASLPPGRPPAATRLAGVAAAVALVLGTGVALLADGAAPTAVPAADGTAAVAPAVAPSSTPLPHPTPTATRSALKAVLASSTTRSASTHPASTSVGAPAAKPVPAPHRAAHKPVQHHGSAHHQKPARHEKPAHHHKPARAKAPGSGGHHRG